MLFVQVLVAIVLGGLLGFFYPVAGEAAGWLGDLFVNLVKMIIAPVIFLTVASGVAGLRDIGAVGRVAAKTMVYFLFVSSLALIVGLAAGNWVRPGSGMHIDAGSLDASSVAPYSDVAHDLTFNGFVSSIVPTTMVSALTDDSILQVLFVAIWFGAALSLVGPVGQPVLNLLEQITHVIYKVADLLMRASPIGAFGAIAFTIGKYGLASLVSLGALLVTFYLSCLIFVLFVLGAVMWAAGFSIFKLIRYLGPELVLVLSTASSQAALPKLIEKMERAGCERTVVGIVVPTGYSFNLVGTNIYLTLTAMFISQALDVHLSLAQQFGLLLISILSSKGVSGIPGASFIALTATLSLMPTVPVAGVALILGADRILSVCRSPTNFIGNAVATVAIARWAGALDKEMLRKQLSSTSSS